MDEMPGLTTALRAVDDVDRNNTNGGVSIPTSSHCSFLALLSRSDLGELSMLSILRMIMT